MLQNLLAGVGLLWYQYEKCLLVWTMVEAARIVVVVDVYV
jgi:hypothetical protein